MRAGVSGARHPFSASNGYGRWSVTAFHAAGVGDHEFLRIPHLTSNAAFQASAWSFSTCCAGRDSCSQGTVRRRWVNAENMFRKTRRGALPAASDTTSGHRHCVSSIPFHTHRHAPAMRQLHGEGLAARRQPVRPIPVWDSLIHAKRHPPNAAFRDRNAQALSHPPSRHSHKNETSRRSIVNQHI